MNLNTEVEQPQRTQGTQGWKLEDERSLTWQVIELVPAGLSVSLCSLGSLWLNRSVRAQPRWTPVEQGLARAAAIGRGGRRLGQGSRHKESQDAQKGIPNSQPFASGAVEDSQLLHLLRLLAAAQSGDGGAQPRRRYAKLHGEGGEGTEALLAEPCASAIPLLTLIPSPR